MAQKSPTAPKSYAQQSRAILIALLFPSIAMILNGAMFSVALPTIRDEFMMAPDVTAWMAIAYSLPYMLFMPLFGRFGDELGKSRLLLFGVLILVLGTLLIYVAGNLALIFIGRIIQGIGASGSTPLSLAILSQRFPEEERGRAMATWNLAAPGASIVAPTLSGFLVDSLGWRTILIPVFVIAVAAFFIVRHWVPTLRGKPNWSVLRHFDWGGTVLLTGFIVSLVFFLSSRPITGVEPLRDWRLFLLFILFTGGFLYWENRQTNPLIDLNLMTQGRFRRASVIAAFRMMMMAGIGFLLPLYLTDIYNLSATRVGTFGTVHAIVLFASIWWGGQLSDRYSTRLLIRISTAVQVIAMGLFALFQGGLPLWVIMLVTLLHGAGAGLNLGSLHKRALGGVPEEKSGSAAGVYSMTRFAGSMLGIALMGVILQLAQDGGLSVLTSYRFTYGFVVVMGLISLMIAWQMGPESR